MGNNRILRGSRCEIWVWAQGTAKRMKVVKAVALHRDAQRAVKANATTIHARATFILAAHRDRGDSSIRMARGRVDWWVELVDRPTDGHKPDALGIEINTQALRRAIGFIT